MTATTTLSPCLSRTNAPDEFIVSNAEVDQMVDELLKVQSSWDKNEIHNLSKAWIRAVMSQPYKKNKDQRRPFDYSKKKLIDYLDWRNQSCITCQISHHLGDDGKDIAKLGSNKNDLYWYGVDGEGSPILWLVYGRDSNFDGINVKNQMEATALVIQAGLDAMPPNIHNFTFVVLFDKLNPMKALKKPTLAPEFIKTFMRICPDRLKQCIFVTGSLGHVFYKLVHRLAPTSIMNKVVEARSRAEASKVLIDTNSVKECELPNFMGGSFVHEDKITSHFPTMIEGINVAMKGATRSR